MPVGCTFQDAVSAIIKHRKDNPRFNLSTDPGQVAIELDEFNCALLKNNPSWCDGVSTTSFQLPPSARRQPVGVRESVAVGNPNFLQNVTVGIKVWRDWFGSGKPAEKSLA